MSTRDIILVVIVVFAVIGLIAVLSAVDQAELRQMQALRGLRNVFLLPVPHSVCGLLDYCIFSETSAIINI